MCLLGLLLCRYITAVPPGAWCDRNQRRGSLPTQALRVSASGRPRLRVMWKKTAIRLHTAAGRRRCRVCLCSRALAGYCCRPAYRPGEYVSAPSGHRLAAADVTTFLSCVKSPSGPAAACRLVCQRYQQQAAAERPRNAAFVCGVLVPGPKKLFLCPEGRVATGEGRLAQ